MFIHSADAFFFQNGLEVRNKTVDRGIKGNDKRSKMKMQEQTEKLKNTEFAFPHKETQRYINKHCDLRNSSYSGVLQMNATSHEVITHTNDTNQRYIQYTQLGQ